jgi:hypothetical protein
MDDDWVFIKRYLRDYSSFYIYFGLDSYVLCSNQASSHTVESEGRQKKLFRTPTLSNELRSFPDLKFL